MADSDKNILITPNQGSTNDPKIEFTGGDNNTVTLSTLDEGTLSFSGSSGQLFSISDSLTGTIFSVNDISGIPSIEVDDDGTLRFAEFAGNVLVGTDVDDGTNKLQVDGTIAATGYNNSNWDTAYGWDDHSTQGYLTSVPAEYLTRTEGDALYVPLGTSTESIFAPRETTGTGIDFTKDVATRIARITGDRLASSVRVSITGTTGSVVINVIADIMVNHSGNIQIATQSSDYTSVELTVKSDNNQNFDLIMKYTTGDATGNFAVEIFPLASETVTWDVSQLPVYTGTTAVHTTGSGVVKYSQTSGNVDIVTDGTLSASGYNDTNWNTAYSWGDHSTQGYLTSVPAEYLTQTEGDARYHALSGSDLYKSATYPTNTFIKQSNETEYTGLTIASVGGVGVILDTNNNDVSDFIVAHGSTDIDTATKLFDINGAGQGATIYLDAETSRAPVGLTLHSTVADIAGNGYTDGNFIDFKVTDTNATFTPQARIGMLVKDYSGDGGIPSKGTGNFTISVGQGTDAAGNGTLKEALVIREDNLIATGVSYSFTAYGNILSSYGNITANNGYVKSGSGGFYVSDNQVIDGSRNADFVNGTFAGGVEIAGANGAIGSEPFTYSYATGTSLLVKGNEPSVDIVGSDAGNHGSSLLLRNVNEGFGFINDPANDRLELKSFTVTDNNFQVHATGSNVDELTTLATFNKSGTVDFGGVISTTGGNSTEWNTGYDYSQVGHLPLTGGSLSGDLIVNSSTSGTMGGGVNLANYHLRVGGTSGLHVDSNEIFTQDATLHIGSKSSAGSQILFHAEDGVAEGTQPAEIMAITPTYVRTNKLTHIREDEIGASAGSFASALIEAVDAHLEIASNSAGSWGSAVTFKEYDQTTEDFVNNWSIARNTGATPSLNFNFGTGNDHNIAGVKVRFSSTGVIYANGGNSGEWNTAYGWGDHSTQNYLKADSSYTLTGDLKVTTGSIAYESDQYMGFIPFPTGAQFRSDDNSHDGYIKISLPDVVDSGDDMISFWVDIYDYTSNETVSLFVGGYNYTTSTTSNYWINCHALVLAKQSSKDFNVRFGFDGTRKYIAIGETNSIWSHPSVVVRDFQASFRGNIDQYRDDWSISISTTALTGVDETVSANLPLASSASKWTTARTLSLTGDVTGSVSWDGSANATLTTTVANDSHNHTHSDGAFTVNGSLTTTGNIIMPNDNYVNRTFTMIENAATQYILLCANAGSNDVNATIRIDRTSGNYQAVILDVIVTSGSATMFGGTLRTLQVIQNSEDYRLVSVTYGGNNWIAIKYTGNAYPMTFPCTVTGRIKSTLPSELTVVSSGITNEASFGGNSESYQEVDNFVVSGDTTSSNGLFNGQLIVDGGTGVSSSGTLHLRQKGDTVNDGMAITSSNTTAHRIWKDASGVLNFGISTNGDQFGIDTSGNLKVNGTTFIDGSRNANLGTVAATTITATTDSSHKWYSKTTNVGVTHEFSDLVPDYGQKGYLKYFHSDSKSHGSGNAFTLTSNQTDLSLAVDGKIIGTSFHVGFDATSSGTEIVDSARNLTNIGSISASGRLTITDDTGGDGGWSGGILIKNTSATAGEPAIAFQNTAMGSNYWIVGSNQDDELHFGYGTSFTDGGTKVIVKTDGKVGINRGVGTLSNHLEVGGSILATDNITAYSDRRLKDNIKTLDGSKVYEMRGVSFTKEGEQGSGVIAQELEQVAPELVLTNSDDMQTKSVAYGNVVGYLIEAIKEQKSIIDEQQKQIENLTNLVNQLMEK